MGVGITRRQFAASASFAFFVPAVSGCSFGEEDSESLNKLDDESSSNSEQESNGLKESLPSQTDTESRYFSQQEPDEPQPYLAEGGWSYVTYPDAGTSLVNFSVILGCSDSVNCYVSMGLKVTALDDSGTIIASQDFGIEFIAPNDVMPIAGSISVEAEPSRLEYQLSTGAGSPPGNPYTLSDLPVSNTSEIVGDLETHWTGEYSNNCGVDFPNGAYPVVVLRSSGNIVGGFSDQTQRTPISDGESSYFDIGEYNMSIPEHDSFDVWMVPSLM